MRCLRTGCLVDRFQCRRQALAILPARQIQRIADQVHDAGLDLCLRVNRFDGFRETPQAIDHRNQHIFQPPVSEFIEDLQPELGPLTSFLPSARMPSARYTALFLTVPSSRIFSRKASK